MAAAASGCGDIMVVLPLIGCYHCPEVMGSSLHMLSNGTSLVCALVVAPTRNQDITEKRVKVFSIIQTSKGRKSMYSIHFFNK